MPSVQLGPGETELHAVEGRRGTRYIITNQRVLAIKSDGTVTRYPLSDYQKSWTQRDILAMLGLGAPQVLAVFGKHLRLDSEGYVWFNFQTMEEAREFVRQLNSAVLSSGQ